MPNGHIDANIPKTISPATELGIFRDITTPRAVTSSLQNAAPKVVPLSLCILSSILHNRVSAVIAVLDASRPRRLRLTRRVASRAIFVGVLLILTSLFTIEGVATVPGVPTGLTATAGDRQVKLSWTAPTDIGSSPINDYTIYYYTTDPNEITENETGEVSTTFTVTGLTNGTLYTFMVSAWNDSGFGSESSSATATPNIPTPTGLTASSGEDGQVTLSWTAPSLVTVTRYEYNQNGGTSWTSTGTTTSVTVTGLTNGTQYTFSVRVVSANGNGTPSSSVTGTPNLAAPTGLTATGGDGQVTLSWTAPSVSTITGYQYKRDSQAWASAGTASPYIVTGLINGTSYTFKVRAVGAGGNGMESGSVTGTPNLAAPTGLTAAGGDSQVTLSWTAPSVSTITGYQYKRDSQAWASAGTASPYIVTGLVNGTSYTFKVRAIGAGGNGMESGSATGTPTAPPPQQPQQPQQPPPQQPQQPADSTQPANPQQSANPLPLTESNPLISYSLIAQRIDNPTVSLSWNIPRGINPQTILEYQYSMDAGQTWTSTGSLDRSIILNTDTAVDLPLDWFKVRGISLNADGTARLVTFILSRPQQQPTQQECPVGWVRSDGFAGRTRRVLLYEVNLEMDMSNPISIYKPVWVAIYVHPDEGLENLEGWKLQVALPYNQHSEYLLTAENSVVVDAGFVKGGFAFIKNPEDAPFPMVGIGFTGSPAPGFDYRLHDDTGRRVDFGISCYKQGDIFQVLKEMEDPRVLRKVLLETLDWDSQYIRTEWTVPVPVPAAPSQRKGNIVGTWADLKKK